MRIDWLPVALVVLTAAGYAAWRLPGELYWDDSLAVCENADHTTGASRDSLRDTAFFRSLWTRDFGGLHPDGYRPLNWVVRRMGSAFWHDVAWAGTAMVWLNGIVAGLLAANFFRLARRFTHSTAAALLAVFLLLASTPMLTGWLVLFAGIQALVPLTMCTALNCYFDMTERAGTAGASGETPAISAQAKGTSARGRWRMLVLAVLLFVAPLYREFAGLTSLLILFLEMQRGKWRSGTALMAAASFVHAVFPTALPRLLFPELPVRPVFQLGVLEQQMRMDVAGRWWHRGEHLLGSLQWRILLDIFSILPPTLVLAALCAAVWLACRKWQISWRERAERAKGDCHAVTLNGNATCLGPSPTRSPCKGVLFLAVFLALSFLPFLKVFKEQVHLAYCLVPAAILLTMAFAAAWRTAANRPAVRMLLVMILAISLADHALNIVVVRGATRACYGAIDRVAERCRRDLPAGSALVVNSHHGNDLQVRSGGHVRAYFSVLTGGQRERLIDSPQALEQLLERYGEGSVWCLDVRLPRRKGQRGARRVHWIVRDQPVELAAVGRIQAVSYRYPVIDPLKLLLPVKNMAWPTSPDLEFDYYRGPALDGTFYLREVAVEYYLYGVARKAG